MSPGCVIETFCLSKHYRQVEAVRELSMRVGAGRITGFLGRNGAGKSTAIRMLLGMTAPSSGTGLVLGRAIDNSAQSREIRRRAAYVAEDKPLYRYLTVAEKISWTRAFYRDWSKQTERRLIQRWNLPLHRKVGALSKGMRTKLSLALALSRNSELLILDEPSEGLDPVGIEQLLEEIQAAAANGVTVFFSSHQIAEVERIVDQVVIIDGGRLKIDISMDDMQKQCRRIAVGSTGAFPLAEFAGDGVTAARAGDRRTIITVTKNADMWIQRVHALGIGPVEVAPLSLRDLFLETTSGDCR